MPSALIVGAGLTGLTAAHALATAGWQVRLVDEGRTPGGRFATRWQGERARRVDIGAQFLTARDPAFAAVVADWERQGWVRRWCDGIPVLGPAGLADGRDGFPRWLGSAGMGGLARHLAAGLELDQPATVTDVRPDGGCWVVTVEPGDAVGGMASEAARPVRADAVLLTLPAPRAADLLAASRLAAPTGLSAVLFDPCLCLVVDLPTAPVALLAHPGAVRIDDPASPLSWVASARGRGQLAAGDALLLHFRGDWSAERFTRDEPALLAEMAAAATPTLVRLGLVEPLPMAGAFLHRWRHSRCAAPCPAPFLSVGGSAPLLIAGDGFGACPRVEGAWLSGMAAARALIAG
jgi:renalase